MTKNIYLKPKAQVTLNRDTELIISLMPRTKLGRLLFPVLFIIVLKLLSNIKGQEIDMNHNYRGERKVSFLVHDNIVFLENSRGPTEKQYSDGLQHKYTGTSNDVHWSIVLKEQLEST